MNREKINVNLEKLIVIGDRVLIRPAPAQERTKVGLYLPQTVREKDEVITGDIVKTGPGLPLADPANIRDEPWEKDDSPVRYLPMEARAGDRALFLRKASIEIQYEGERFLIVPQSAILLLIREDIPPAQDDGELFAGNSGDSRVDPPF